MEKVEYGIMEKNMNKKYEMMNAWQQWLHHQQHHHHHHSSCNICISTIIITHNVYIRIMYTSCMFRSWCGYCGHAHRIVVITILIASTVF